MTTRFDQELTGFRYVDLRHGETLQRLALRELGDAARWVDIANLNGLRAPWVTGDPLQSSESVALYGRTLLVPAAEAEITADVAPDRVFEIDIELRDGVLVAGGDDFAVVAGRANLEQAIHHRLRTEPGELVFHPRYGCRVRELIGNANGPMAASLGGEYVRGALRSDPRIRAAPSVTVEARGDTMAITAVAATITGKTISIEEVL